LDYQQLGIRRESAPLAGKAAEGAIGATPCSFFGQKSDGMDAVVASAKKYDPGVPLSKRMIRTVQAWGDALILWEAMKRADKAGDLTGEGILKKGFETFRNFHIGLGASDVTYTSTDHRPCTGCMIQQYKNGKFVRLEYVNLKKRWPKKWAHEWLGW